MLNPRKGELTRIIDEDYSWDDDFLMKHLYDPCIEALAGEDYRQIRKEAVYGPVTITLINWGQMLRVLHRKEYKGWEERLVKAIRQNGELLENFKKMLLTKTDLQLYKNDIKKCYKDICNVVGYTAVAKTLHILAPDFFPMWDGEIRNRARKESKKRINNTPDGYFEFMQVMKEFLQTHNDELSELSKKYKRPKLKLMDQYFWLVTR